ncbi:hypothetical protein DPMN_078391 [Dreissena polymorpha]|uniref:Uncharacterized protein n=1 Tax=Dreissena polymorpha TaxID=45954 RepID=A0A9D3YNQ6_DREPO|nr:hypothetical protein DPMN_078391 [Dreissena polymorpha]
MVACTPFGSSDKMSLMRINKVGYKTPPCGPFITAIIFPAKTVSDTQVVQVRLALDSTKEKLNEEPVRYSFSKSFCRSMKAARVSVISRNASYV